MYRNDTDALISSLGFSTEEISDIVSGILGEDEGDDLQDEELQSLIDGICVSDEEGEEEKEEEKDKIEEIICNKEEEEEKDKLEEPDSIKGELEEEKEESEKKEEGSEEEKEDENKGVECKNGENEEKEQESDKNNETEKEETNNSSEAMNIESQGDNSAPENLSPPKKENWAPPPPLRIRNQFQKVQEEKRKNRPPVPIRNKKHRSGSELPLNIPISRVHSENVLIKQIHKKGAPKKRLSHAQILGKDRSSSLPGLDISPAGS